MLPLQGPGSRPHRKQSAPGRLHSPTTWPPPRSANGSKLKFVEIMSKLQGRGPTRKKNGRAKPCKVLYFCQNPNGPKSREKKPDVKSQGRGPTRKKTIPRADAKPKQARPWPRFLFSRNGNVMGPQRNPSIVRAVHDISNGRAKIHTGPKLG